MGGSVTRRGIYYSSLSCTWHRASSILLFETRASHRGGFYSSALVQPPLETHISAAGYDDYGDHHHHRNSVGSSIEEVYGYDCDDGADRAGNIADTDCVARGHQRRPQTHQHQLEPSSYAAPSTASEPGDFYDYGWDYETAASSGHQTPQTPMSYHYQQQQQRQLKRQRRRGGRPVSPTRVLNVDAHRYSRSPE